MREASNKEACEYGTCSCHQRKEVCTEVIQRQSWTFRSEDSPARVEQTVKNNIPFDSHEIHSRTGPTDKKSYRDSKVQSHHDAKTVPGRVHELRPPFT